MYFYKVTAVNGIGESPQSDSILGEIKTPSAPTNVVAEALSDSSIKVTWDPVPGATLYTVYSGSSALISITDNFYIHTGRDSATKYSYQISATNTVGAGPKSNTVDIFTQPILLSENKWYSGNLRYKESLYFSFSVNGGNYTIEWIDKNNGDKSKTGEARVYAYWKNTNSMVSLSSDGDMLSSNYISPQTIINAPDTGYIIIRIEDVYYTHGGTYAIRYYM
jgi:hypothetical protein